MNVRISLGLIFLALAMALAVARPAVAQTEVLQRNIEAQAGEVLELEVDRGNIEVETRDRSGVRIVLLRTDDPSMSREELQAQHELTTERQNGRIIIRAEHASSDGRGFLARLRGKEDPQILFRLQVPRQFGLNLDTGAGNVCVSELDGTLAVRTGAGNVQAARIAESLQVQTGAGNVDVEGAGRNTQIDTGAGNVQVRDVRGALRVETGAGNISAWITAQPTGASQLSSGAGNVTVYLADQVGVEVRGSTGMGSVSTDYPLNMEGGWVGRSFHGTVGQGGAQLQLSSGIGNVALKRR